MKEIKIVFLNVVEEIIREESEWKYLYFGDLLCVFWEYSKFYFDERKYFNDLILLFYVNVLYRIIVN